ncbi:hypothetical protein KTR9_0511 [Gordonia sp. KTR9]|nr:hypothetical protein KTR9_0511 [Gordonia sp. KTR9]
MRSASSSTLPPPPGPASTPSGSTVGSCAPATDSPDARTRRCPSSGTRVRTHRHYDASASGTPIATSPFCSPFRNDSSRRPPSPGNQGSRYRC